MPQFISLDIPKKITQNMREAIIEISLLSSLHYAHQKLLHVTVPFHWTSLHAYINPPETKKTQNIPPLNQNVNFVKPCPMAMV